MTSLLYVCGCAHVNFKVAIWVHLNISRKSFWLCQCSKRFGSINTIINCCIALQQTEATCMVVCGKEEDYQDPFCN